jgi:integrative and conjugative element protein (TIGR02256 family)
MTREIVWITNQCVELMVEQADRLFPKEVGGVLMGYRASATRETVVTHVIGPGPRASCQQTRFIPDKRYQLDAIHTHYQESGRRETYLGDWHTHPRSGSDLSPIDARALSTIAKSKASNQPNPLMGILAGGDPWLLTVWRFRSGLIPRAPEAMEIRLF